MTTITTGDLNRHFGVTMTTDFIKELGFKPAETARAGHPRWAVSDVPAIGQALKDHMEERMTAKVVPVPPAPKKPGKVAATPPVDEDDGL